MYYLFYQNYFVKEKSFDLVAVKFIQIEKSIYYDFMMSGDSSIERNLLKQQIAFIRPYRYT